MWNWTENAKYATGPIFFIHSRSPWQSAIFAHLQIANQNPSGTHSEPCLKLADFHSDAVDFAKTGRHVEFKTFLRCRSTHQTSCVLNGKYRPSTKVLGRLFRAVPAAEEISIASTLSRNALDNTRSLTNRLQSALIHNDDGHSVALGVLVSRFRQSALPHFCQTLCYLAHGNTFTKARLSTLRRRSSCRNYSRR